MEGRDHCKKLIVNVGPLMSIKVINPINDPNWDNQLITGSNNYSFFHTAAWAKTLYESYNYKPLYFSSFEDNVFKLLFPLMEVKSIFTGHRAVSLPFTDYCTPILDPSTFFDTFSKIAQYGAEQGWKYIDIKVPVGYLEDKISYLPSYRHILDIDQSMESMVSNFGSSHRRNIKKANKQQLEIVFSNSLNSVLQFYKLNCLTRKMHGLPPQPLHFFKNVHEFIIGKNYGMVVKAIYKGKVIAASVFFHLHKKAIYKYGASDYQHQSLRANNLTMYKAIEWYHEKGYHEFCFGKTDPHNEGLRRFKLGWGTREEIIGNSRFDLTKNAFITSSSKTVGFYTKIFRNLPIKLLRTFGNVLYKHMG